MTASRRAPARRLQSRAPARMKPRACYLHIHALLITAAITALTSAAYISVAHSAGAATCQSTAIPAYSYPSPTTFWDNAVAAHPPVSIMVANPATGPGSSADSNYTAIIAKTKAAGVKVLGYVDTGYSSRSTASVKADISQWKTLYGVTDIFLDETSSGAGQLAYYQGLADNVHATSGAIVMLNPGTTVVEGYAAFSDIINIFEGTKSDYAGFTMPGWTANYASSKFSHLIYGVPDAASMTSTLAASNSRKAGYVYITNDTMPNPWDQLPPYWSAEAAQIKQTCVSPASTGSTTGSTAGTSTPGTNSAAASNSAKPLPSITSNTSVRKPAAQQGTAASTDGGSTAVITPPSGSLDDDDNFDDEAVMSPSRLRQVLVVLGGAVALASALFLLWFLHRRAGHHLNNSNFSQPKLTGPTVRR